MGAREKELSHAQDRLQKQRAKYQRTTEEFAVATKEFEIAAAAEPTALVSPGCCEGLLNVVPKLLDIGALGVFCQAARLSDKRFHNAVNTVMAQLRLLDCVISPTRKEGRVQFKILTR